MAGAVVMATAATMPTETTPAPSALLRRDCDISVLPSGGDERIDASHPRTVYEHVYNTCAEGEEVTHGKCSR